LQNWEDEDDFETSGGTVSVTNETSILGILIFLNYFILSDI